MPGHDSSPRENPRRCYSWSRLLAEWKAGRTRWKGARRAVAVVGEGLEAAQSLQMVGIAATNLKKQKQKNVAMNL